MTEAAIKRQQRRIRKIVAEWKTTLLLGPWRIDIEYWMTDLEGHERDPRSGFSVFADIEPRWEYLHAILRIHVPAIAGMDDLDLERLLLHELCHCLVNEMSTPTHSKVKHEERVVSHLTNAFIEAKYVAKGTK